MYHKNKHGSLVQIENDQDVLKMAQQHEEKKKFWVLVTRQKEEGAIRGSPPQAGPLRNLIVMEPEGKNHATEPVQRELQNEDEEETDNDLGSDGYFFDNPNEDMVLTQKEKLLEIMEERKREHIDPATHCEGDSDVDEDLYVVDIVEGKQLVPAHLKGDVQIDVANKENQVVIHNQTKCKEDKGNYVGSKDDGKIAKDIFSPSSDGEEFLLDSEDDDGAVVEEVKRKRRRLARLRGVRVMFNESNILDPTQLCKSMCFTDVKQFRRALKVYHIVMCRDYCYIRNAPDRVIVKCKDDICPFYMYASEIAGEKTMMIRKLAVSHTFGVTMESSRVNSKFISEVFEEQIRSDPDWKVTTLMDETQRKFGVEISKVMAYRARAIAAEKVLGNHKKQYTRIRDYCHTVLVKNPGSHVVVKTTPRPEQGLNPLFCGLFMCLNAQKEGFLARCRPFIGVDGCFVKLTNGAQVLTATGRDGNNNLYPLAFGVVGKEDGLNWTWFLEMLKMVVGDDHEHGGWTIMSD